jgi:hypothetical protein
MIQAAARVNLPLSMAADHEFPGGTPRTPPACWPLRGYRVSKAHSQKPSSAVWVVAAAEVPTEIPTEVSTEVLRSRVPSKIFVNAK